MFEQALENIEDALRKQADRTTELDYIEQTLLLRKNGIEAYIGREVLPHVPDAWYGQESVKVGYEVSFMCYSYKPQPLRSLEEIRADILVVEKETGGLLGEIIGGGRA